MLKKITGILIILSVLIILAACGDTENVGGPENNTAAGENNQGDTVNNDAAEDNQAGDTRPASVLPGEKDFAGREFRVLRQARDVEQLYHLFIVEEMNGEPINDSLLERNSRIEEKYNIKFVQSDINDPSATIRNTVRAGDNAYELMIDIIRNTANLGAQSMLLDLYNAPYISESLALNNPWWCKSLTQDLAINNTLYFQTGDLLMFDKLRLAIVYFNKDMFQTLGYDYPYQMVHDGTWTIDRLAEFTRGVNQDLNGDGIMDQYDQWGFMSQHAASFHFFAGAGLRTITLDNDGVPEITMSSPRALDVIQKVLAFCTEPEGMFHADTIRGAANVWTQASAYFQENRFALRSSVFEPIVRDLRAMETDFGILPFPKFNEAQENYYSAVDPWGWVVALPNNADPDFAGFIAEALAYESGDTLMPAFYDLTLLTKTARDDESEDMLDIIFNGKVYDIGEIFDIGGLTGLFSTLVSSGSMDFVSRFESVEPRAQTALERFIDTYDAD